MSNCLESILVAACGNSMAGDDAFGPLVAQSLQHDPIPGVEAVDLGTNPSMLLDVLGGQRALVIVDAAIAPNLAPGTLIDCEWQSAVRPVLAHERTTSTHGLAIGDQIELARTIGMLPQIIRLIAVAAVRPSSAASSLSDQPSELVTSQIRNARARIAHLAQSIATRSLTEMSYA
jgi:hydrogenase maturation protease